MSLDSVERNFLSLFAPDSQADIICIGYTYFFETVSGKSCVYMLKRIGARTDPCRRPLVRRRRRLSWSPAWRMKLRLLINSMMKRTIVLFGSKRSSLSFRPMCQTVSYAAIRSTRTVPTLSPSSKEASMFMG